MTFKILTPKRFRTKGGSVNEDSPLRFSIYTAKKSGRFIMNAFIHDSLLSKVGLSIGDRAEMLYDPEDNTGLIRKTEQEAISGYVLSSSGGQSNSNVARIARTMYPNEEEPFDLEAMHLIDAEEVEVREEGILFIFPNGRGLKSKLAFIK